MQFGGLFCHDPSESQIREPLVGAVASPVLHTRLKLVPVGLARSGNITVPPDIIRFKAEHIWAVQSEGLFVQLLSDPQMRLPFVGDVPYPELQPMVNEVSVGLSLFGVTTPLPITRFEAAHIWTEQSGGLFSQVPPEEQTRFPLVGVVL